VDEVIAELRAARAAGTSQYFFLEGDLNALGYQLMNAGQLDDARAVLQLNADVFPGSWNVWDSLAEAHMKAGEHDRAVELYRKSLELNPDNENGKEMLARLGSE
jgi:tetratricopeptide (TPR) repeat protein